MLANIDHVTIAVTDLDATRRFFELLGLEVTKSVVIKGPVMDEYMGVPGIEADHVTMVIPGQEVHQEIQLLHYHQPRVDRDPALGNLARDGFNHICFRVSDLDATVATLTAAGVTTRNAPMTFHDRKLVFLDGPDHVVIELAEWIDPLS
jgi:catechol 2,3-dioxygenase-like lactoylglutathione lyase family enzyme